MKQNKNIIFAKRGLLGIHKTDTNFMKLDLYIMKMNDLTIFVFNYYFHFYINSKLILNDFNLFHVFYETVDE